MVGVLKLVWCTLRLIFVEWEKISGAIRWCGQ